MGELASSFSGDVSVNNCFHKETRESTEVALRLVPAVTEGVVVSTLLARSTWEKGACQRKSLCVPSKLLEDEGSTAMMDQV